MAWVTVPGSNGIWQYENTATASVSHYKDADAGSTVTTSAGIRTYSGLFSTAVYVRCRKTGQTQESGELSKTYYDAQ